MAESRDTSMLKEENMSESESTLNTSQDPSIIKEVKDEDKASDNEQLKTDADDEVVTMLDVLEEEEELEENAFAVLGNSDDKNCTYFQGYVTRQALYACITCSSEGEPAAICLACSYACHQDHELYELYTKRNFRCDCGNSKFPQNPCKIYPRKEPVNTENKYNHNFFGKYCTCDRPYPDPTFEDEMIQCIICEDWYHGVHLDTKVPDDDSYAEMTCKSCMSKYPFLWNYHEEIQNANETILSLEAVKIPDTAIDSGFESSNDSLVTACKLKDRKITKKPKENDSCAFWSDDWRGNLCQCVDCIKMYKELDCLYLINKEDTVKYYEAQGKEKSIKVSQYERGMSALNQLNRVDQVEALHAYNEFKTELSDYLKKFATNNKVVREEDIQEFFSGLQAKKRQKVAHPIPFNCR